MNPAPNPIIEEIHATRARMMTEGGNDLRQVMNRLQDSQDGRIRSGFRMADIKPVRPKPPARKALTHSQSSQSHECHSRQS